MLNPNMPTQELLLHMGELTANEVRVARAAIEWANSYNEPIKKALVEAAIPLEAMTLSGAHLTLSPGMQKGIEGAVMKIREVFKIEN